MQRNVSQTNIGDILMGRIKSPGLFNRNGIWHIDKQINGQRLRESTGSAELAEAERYLVKRIEDVRQACIYGVRPKRNFRQAAAKYLKENQYKASIDDDALHLKQLDVFIGDLKLEQVHIGALQPFINAKKASGRKTKSINLALGVVRHILNLAATEWLDENGLTWLHFAPKIKLLPVTDVDHPILYHGKNKTDYLGNCRHIYAEWLCLKLILAAVNRKFVNYNGSGKYNYWN